MTAASEGFESAWSEIGPWLQRYLISRKLDAFTAEDIAQETAFRVFRHWDEIDHERSLKPLSVTIAMNLVRDRARRSKREALTDAPESTSIDDVEATALARLELARVGKALNCLSQDQQRLVTYELRAKDAHLPSRSEAAVKMARLRARKKLISAMKTTTVLTAAAWLKLKEAVSLRGENAVALGAAAAILATVPFGAASSLPGRSSQPGYSAASTHEHANGAQSSRHSIRKAQRAVAVAAVDAAKTTQADASSESSKDEGDPVRIPIGDDGSEVQAEVTVEVEDKVVRVTDNEGGAPVCTERVPGSPSQCNEDPEE